MSTSESECSAASLAAVDEDEEAAELNRKMKAALKNRVTGLKTRHGLGRPYSRSYGGCQMPCCLVKIP